MAETLICAPNTLAQHSLHISTQISLPFCDRRFINQYQSFIMEVLPTTGNIKALATLLSRTFMLHVNQYRK